MSITIIALTRRFGKKRDISEMIQNSRGKIWTGGLKGMSSPSESPPHFRLAESARGLSSMA